MKDLSDYWPRLFLGQLVLLPSTALSDKAIEKDKALHGGRATAIEKQREQMIRFLIIERLPL